MQGKLLILGSEVVWLQCVLSSFDGAGFGGCDWSSLGSAWFRYHSWRCHIQVELVLNSFVQGVTRAALALPVSGLELEPGSMLPGLGPKVVQVAAVLEVVFAG